MLFINKVLLQSRASYDKMHSIVDFLQEQFPNDEVQLAIIK